MSSDSLLVSRLPVVEEAARDYFYLLNHGYPREASLKLVGDRYDLVHLERELLHRGISSRREALGRRRKRLLEACLADRTLAVDGHNVHITMESGLSGKPLLLANDGAMRDVAGQSSRFRFSGTGLTVLDRVFSFLERHKPAKVLFYFDSPMSRSGEMAAEYRRRLRDSGIDGEAEAVPVPERAIPFLSAVVASSDREVLNEATAWLDLARLCLEAAGPVPLYVDFSSYC